MVLDYTTATGQGSRDAWHITRSNGKIVESTWEWLALPSSPPEDKGKDPGLAELWVIRIPSVLHACRESRMIAMKTHKVVYDIEQSPKPLRYFSSELDVLFLCRKDIEIMVRFSRSDETSSYIFSQMSAQHVHSVTLTSGVVLKELKSEKATVPSAHSFLMNVETALAYLLNLRTIFVQRIELSAEVAEDFALIQSRLERSLWAIFK